MSGMLGFIHEQPWVTYAASAAIISLTTVFATSILTPKLDPDEPPLVQPRMPLVGHLFGLMLNQVSYFSHMYDRTHLPIATLPIVNSKLYVIMSAPLQQSAMRSRNMNAQSFTVEFIPRLFGISPATLNRLLGRDGAYPSIMPEMERVFQTTLSGKHLDKLTLRALECFGETLNGLEGGRGLDIPNMYLWLRQKMSKATSQALWGRENNPYGKDESVVDAQWDFEANMGPLILGVLPSIFAHTAYRSRKKVQTALLRYYAAELDQRDPLASEFIRARSRLFRAYNLPAEELARNEVSIMLAATTNTIPTLFWFVENVWLRPDVVADLRTEVAPALSIATPAGAPRIATVHAARLETACPLLASCYRESVRLASQIITFRHVLADTRVADGAGGSYLFKAGNNVMMPAKVVHRHQPTWGADADAFDPRRFVSVDPANDAAQRQRKAAFVPFGGGKHLCPGRHFAFAENLAIMAALLSGFEIRGLRAEKLRMRDSKMGEAAKPAVGFEGGPVVMARRAGWEVIEYKSSEVRFVLRWSSF